MTHLQIVSTVLVTFGTACPPLGVQQEEAIIGAASLLPPGLQQQEAVGAAHPGVQQEQAVRAAYFLTLLFSAECSYNLESCSLKESNCCPGFICITFPAWY